MPQPENVAAVIARDRTFSHDAEGNPITRQRTCECGRQFMQTQLSARFLTIVEKFSAGAMDRVTQQIPDYFVPVHCPPCERIDLRRQAWVDSAHSVPDHFPTSGEAA